MHFSLEEQIAQPTRSILQKFTRGSLRKYAKNLGLRQGKDKENTINNLLNSGKAKICVFLGDE